MNEFEVTIGEINIVCTDGEKSLRFYREVLGFHVESEEHGCWHLTCGGTKFLLLPFANARSQIPDYCSEPTVSFDLLVPDLERAMVYLKKCGVRIMDAPSPNERRFFIRDPDGLVIEVIKA